MILLVISLFHLYLKRKTWIYIYRERDVWGFKGPGNRRLTVHICHQTLFVFWLLAELPPGIPQCPLASQQVRPEPCPSPPRSLESPLLCFTRSTDKTCATDPSPILYTSATRSFIGSPFSGCNVTGASYLDKDHNLCAQSKKLSLFPSHRQISHSMHPQTRTIKVCICIFLVW